MSGKRRKFTPEFRAHSVRLVTETGRPVAHVATEIGIGAQLLGRWVAKAKSDAGGDNKLVLDDDERAELNRLRQENAELRLDRAFLKKSRDLLRSRIESVDAYRLMDAEKAKFTITRMADLLEVSRSGYYKWRAVEAAGPTAAALRRAGLDAKIAAFHAASDKAYGSPRILADLREEGERVSRKTVAASMRRRGLQGISPRQFTPITTVSNASSAVPADLVNRKWDTGQLDRIWTSDITYLATGEGWLYLCGIRDGCSRRVIGWAMADHMRADLVEQALEMAVAFRTTDSGETVFHADRGSQYTSDQIAEYATENGLKCSVGRTGVCWDNAQQESFWASLKVEFYNRRPWATRAEAMAAVGDWIERVYNRRRRHSALGMLTPVQFEQLQRQTAEAA